MSKSKEIGLVLTDFIRIYNHFEKPASAEEGIYKMNGGWCGIVASICAYIARTKFDIPDINICSNALHIYIGYKGKDYDTIYPGGYPNSAAKDWLLEIVGESRDTYCVPAGDEVNKGYYDWGYVYMFKSMCARWNVPLPSYFSRYVAGAENIKSRAVMERKRRMESLYTGALKIPLATVVSSNKVLPFTHYEYAENEPEGYRKLKPIDFKTSSDIDK